MISVLSASFVWVNLRDRRTSERTAHIARVSVEVIERRADVTDYGWTSLGREIAIRNDGPSAVTIGTVALAYGPRWVLNEQRPVFWKLDFVPPGRLPRRLLPPGEELTAEAPEERTDIGILGPVATVVDTNGREWQRTEWAWRPLSDKSRRVSRRGLWFERQPWFSKVDRALYKRGARKVLRRPRRVPWEIHLIDFAWGYRAGHTDIARLPWDAPRTWHYLCLFPPAQADA